VKDEGRFRNDGASNGGHTGGCPVGVFAPVFKGIDPVGKGVEGRVDGTARIQEDEATAGQGVFGIIGKAL